MNLDGGELAILDLLRTRGPLERSRLAMLTGLSPSTVARALRRLRRNGLVWEHPGPAGVRGRPPLIVSLRPDAGRVVGIDAGASMLRAVAADLDGRIELRAARPARDPRDADALVADLIALIGDVSADLDRPTLAVAAGVSGIVDARTGQVLVAPDLPGLAGRILTDELEARLGVAVAVDNDDLLAAIGEATEGAARGSRNVAFLSFGYGLGAGLIMDGRPIRGASSAAGALAFLAGGRLETRASGRWIPERYAEAAASDQASGPDDHRPAAIADARRVFELGADGDPIAREVVAEAIEAIAEAALDVAALLDPEVVILGGGIASVPEVFVRVDTLLRSTLPFPPRLVPSALEGAAVLHGSVALALDLARKTLGSAAGRGPRSRHRPLELVS